MTVLGLAWQGWAFLAFGFLCLCGWWRMVSAEYRAAHIPFEPASEPSPAAPAACLHHRVTDVVSGTLGTVVAQLCLDCDEQLDVPERRWP